MSVSQDAGRGAHCRQPTTKSLDRSLYLKKELHDATHNALSKSISHVRAKFDAKFQTTGQFQTTNTPVTYIPHVEDAIWHEFSGYCGGRNASSGTPSSVSS